MTAVEIAPRARDSELDGLKALAILLVVVGHTLQADPAFDDLFSFRLIYSFHMPAFMMISGMSASRIFYDHIGRHDWRSLLKDCAFRSFRLLVPFYFWALFTAVYLKRESHSVLDWLYQVSIQPDFGLWFLWVLFLCAILTTLSGVVYILASALLLSAKVRNIPKIFIISLHPIAIFATVNFIIMKLSVPHSLYLVKLYFIYYWIGIVSYNYLGIAIPRKLLIMSVVLFSVLFPYWHRTEISSVAFFVNFGLKPQVNNAVFQFLVAVSGTIIFIAVSKCIVKIVPSTLSYLGRRTLDIYAVHFYILHLQPAVVAPILISLVVSVVLRSTRVSAFLALGQWRRDRTLDVMRRRMSRYLSAAPSGPRVDN